MQHYCIFDVFPSVYAIHTSLYTPDDALIVRTISMPLIFNQVGYRSAVSQKEITSVYKLLDIFQTASPFLKAQINT